MESIDSLNEEKILAYFEGCRASFRLKMILLLQMATADQGAFNYSSLSEDAITATEETFPDPIFYKALRNGNQEILEYFKDDIVRGAIIDAWVVFECVIKSLAGGDYSHTSDDLPANYQNNRFAFSRREKKVLELLYYLRNSLVHYNGSFYSKEIKHHYCGVEFNSVGKEGQMIELSFPVAEQFIHDLELLSCKAWNSWESHKSE